MTGGWRGAPWRSLPWRGAPTIAAGPTHPARTSFASRGHTLGPDPARSSGAASPARPYAGRGHVLGADPIKAAGKGI